MRAAGITALARAVEIFEVDELATPPQARSSSTSSPPASATGTSCQDRSWQIGGPAPMALGTEPPGRSQRPLRRGRVARGRRGDDTSAAAPRVTGRGGEGARAGGDRRGPAARGVMGSRRRPFSHSGAHCAQALDEASRIESGGWASSTSRRSYGWPARSSSTRLGAPA